MLLSEGAHLWGMDVLKRFGFKRKDSLEVQLAETDAKLAMMNAQLAAQMVKLAGQTDDLAPLAQAEEALKKARQYFNYEDTPEEVGLVQSAMGDMLLKLGRRKSDKAAIMRARDAYRTAITLASMRGDDGAREELRDQIKIAESLLGKRVQTPSLFKVA